MQKRNCFTSLLCAALFLFILVQCNALAESAALWPRLVCCVGLGLAGLEILVEGIQWARHPGEQQGLWALTPEQTKRSAILLGLLLLWISGLTTIGFLNPANPKKLMSRLRRLFSRNQLETEEVNILRGIARQIEKHAGPKTN